jgi:hypothetical protein
MQDELIKRESQHRHSVLGGKSLAAIIQADTPTYFAVSPMADVNNYFPNKVTRTLVNCGLDMAGLWLLDLAQKPGVHHSGNRFDNPRLDRDVTPILLPSRISIKRDCVRRMPGLE